MHACPKCKSDKAVSERFPVPANLHIPERMVYNCAVCKLDFYVVVETMNGKNRD